MAMCYYMTYSASVVVARSARRLRRLSRHHSALLRHVDRAERRVDVQLGGVEQ